MLEKNCAYCMKDENPELYGKFGYRIADLKASTVYVFKEQSHKGRVIVAYKDHVDDISQLSDTDLLDYMKDIKNVAKAIHKAFNPDKINFGAYGDTMHHLHFHLVPKYHEDSFEWGSTFAMDPNRNKIQDEAELQKIGDEILKYLEK